MSHLHFDHIGGIVPGYEEFLKEKRLLFSNATFITSKTAYERAMSPHPRDKASYIPDIIDLLIPGKNLLLIDENNDFPSEIKEIFSYRISHGHTPGQLLTTVLGSRKNITFCGDLIPGVPWVHLPITMGYDRYPELLIDEKKDFYQSLNLENDLLFYTHDISVCASNVKLNEKNKYEAHDKKQTLLNYEL